MPSGHRRCLSCRRIAPKRELWRIVRLHPSHQIQLDQGMGRSAYVCPQLSCVQGARHKNRLGKALKASIPSSIYQELELRLGVCSPGH